MRRRLEGRVALISGVGSGMGRAGAILFAAEGAAVVGLDRDRELGTETVAAIEAAGGAATLAVGDVSVSADVEAAVRLAVARYGKLDLLWSNAGIGVHKDIVETSEEEWDRVLGVNLKGAYLMAHHGVVELIRAGGGTIVMTGSTNSTIGAPQWAAYCASKGGVLMLCRALALDHAVDRIRVNCICPGSIETPMLRHALDVEGQLPEQIPLDRVGRPEEAAQAALYLSSEESSYVTGTALYVDGGVAAG